MSYLSSHKNSREVEGDISPSSTSPSNRTDPIRLHLPSHPNPPPNIQKAPEGHKEIFIPFLIPEAPPPCKTAHCNVRKCALLSLFHPSLLSNWPWNGGGQKELQRNCPGKVFVGNISLPELPGIPLQGIINFHLSRREPTHPLPTSPGSGERVHTGPGRSCQQAAP